MSTLLLIPWIRFGFQHHENTFLGLTQTRKSLLALLIFEVAFWTLLTLLLDKPDPHIAGQGSFAWMYMFIYEKGIIPTWVAADTINSSLGDRIDDNYQFVYLFVSLVVDYLLLFLISPRLTHLFRTKTSDDSRSQFN